MFCFICNKKAAKERQYCITNIMQIALQPNRLTVKRLLTVSPENLFTEKDIFGVKSFHKSYGHRTPLFATDKQRTSIYIHISL